jgi:hypothetical protein
LILASKLPKREQVIGPEIPQHHYARGNEFGRVKLDPAPLRKQVNNTIVHTQTDERYHAKLGKLNPNIWVGAMKGPDAVEDIIAHHRTGKTRAVGDVFVEPKLFFQEPCYPKIYDNPRNSDNAEFEKFDEKFTHDAGLWTAGRWIFGLLDFRRWTARLWTLEG